MHDYKSLQLMSKLREQFLVNDRLREYIERMLSIIIENSPQLLEITMNTDMPITMSSTNHRSQPLIISSNKTENKPLPPPPEPVKPIESTTKKSNDKYCRL